MSTPEPILDLAAEAQHPVTPAVYARPPVLRTLLRRELWEHRAVWIAPLCVSAVLLIGAIIGKQNFDWSRAALPEQRHALFGVVVGYANLLQYLTLGIITWMYAGDCLYSERKDRSILFWKSMPVSDSLTVLSKLLLVAVLVPFAVYLLSALTTLVLSGIYVARSWQDHSGDVFWDTGTWLRVQGVSFLTLLAAGLWYAPITAFMMLVSAWARRSVQLWIILPPVVLCMMERIALGTHHLMDILFYRLGAVFAHAGTGDLMAGADATGQPLSMNLLFANVDPLPVFANVDLWIGVVVAALLIVATIRIRQYRDDT